MGEGAGTVAIFQMVELSLNVADADTDSVDGYSSLCNFQALGMIRLPLGQMTAHIGMQTSERHGSKGCQPWWLHYLGISTSCYLQSI